MPSECRKCTGDDSDVTLVATKMEIKDQSSAGRSARSLVMSYNKDEASNKLSELSVGDVVNVDGTGNRDVDEEQFTVIVCDRGAGTIEFDTNEHRPTISDNTAANKGTSLNQLGLGPICDDDDNNDVESCTDGTDGEDATKSMVTSSAIEKRRPSPSNMRQRILDLGLDTEEKLDADQVEEDEEEETDGAADDDTTSTAEIKVKADDANKLAARLAAYKRALSVCRQTTKTADGEPLTRKVITDMVEASDAEIADDERSNSDNENDDDNVDDMTTSAEIGRASCRERVY
jgi:hypothetical protein